jgi:hypothetical protein
MNHEIQKLGRFAFRDKQSNGEASKKFVEEFTKSAPQVGRTERNEKSGMKQAEREGVRENLFNKFSNEAQLNVAGPTKRNYPYGTCIDDLYAHSWSNRVGTWLWVPKGTTLVAAESKLGFLARKSEIQCFGWNVRKIFRVVSIKVDRRSFATLIKMDTGWDAGANRGRGLNPRPGEARGNSADPNLLTPDLINMREGKHMGEEEPTWRMILKATKDMEWELSLHGHIITSVNMRIERGWRGRSRI